MAPWVLAAQPSYWLHTALTAQAAEEEAEAEARKRAAEAQPAGPNVIPFPRR